MDRVIFIPDAQVPNHNPTSWQVLLNFTKFYKPTEIIIAGDFIDLNSLSRFQKLSSAESETLDEEIDAANKELDRLDKLTNKTVKKVFLLGNHCKRYETYKLNNWCKEVRHMRNMTTIEDELHLKKRGYKVIPYGGIYQKGYAIFKHGKFTGKYHAAKNLQRYFKNIYYGHTHEWQVHCMIGIDGQPVEAVSCGCLCKTDLIYLDGTPQHWVQMFAYFDFEKNGTYYPHFAKIINGHAYEMGRKF